MPAAAASTAQPCREGPLRPGADGAAEPFYTIEARAKADACLERPRTTSVVVNHDFEHVVASRAHDG
jgi:hypothetical protein